MKWLLIAGGAFLAYMAYQGSRKTLASVLPSSAIQVDSGKVLGIPYTIYMTNAGYYLNISGITTRGPFTQAQAYAALALFGNPQQAPNG